MSSSSVCACRLETHRQMLGFLLVLVAAAVVAVAASSCSLLAAMLEQAVRLLQFQSDEDWCYKCELC